jgi:hypothetical protein
MENTEKIVVERQPVGTRHAIEACSALLLSIFEVLLACLPEVIDTLADGVTEVLFAEET